MEGSSLKEEMRAIVSFCCMCNKTKAVGPICATQLLGVSWSETFSRHQAQSYSCWGVQSCPWPWQQLQEKLLPVLNDAHQRTSAADAESLSHVTEELLLELKAAFTNAPAPIHQEGQINLAI